MSKLFGLSGVRHVLVIMLCVFFVSCKSSAPDGAIITIDADSSSATPMCVDPGQSRFIPFQITVKNADGIPLNDLDVNIVVSASDLVRFFPEFTPTVVPQPDTGTCAAPIFGSPVGASSPIPGIATTNASGVVRLTMQYITGVEYVVTITVTSGTAIVTHEFTSSILAP